MAKRQIVSLQHFAKITHKMLRSDRDVNVGVAGFTGEGKSTFTTKYCKEYAKLAGVHWGFERMTWDRDEMMKWIDGEGDTKKGQLPEYSIIVPDELFLMFYRRNWHDDGQISAIATFNMCRDRHLLVAGNVPNFWNLDGAFQERIRFYVYVSQRGVAWVFQQENNPFSKDQWNALDNLKSFRKNRNPYSCPNFLFEVHFDDWDDQEKKDYLEIRNTKRVEAVKKAEATPKNERLKEKIAFGNLANYLITKKGYSNRKISEIAAVISDKTVAAWSNVAKDKYSKFQT